MINKWSSRGTEVIYGEICKTQLLSQEPIKWFENLKIWKFENAGSRAMAVSKLNR